MWDYLWDHRGGIWVAITTALAGGLFFHWFAWIFRLGRFAETPSTSLPAQPLRFVVAYFFAEIINDFKHFLALVIVLLFAVALFAAMYPGLTAGDIGQVTEGVEAVAAALGGLIGSIIGYYFGESAASRSAALSAVVRDTSSPIQQQVPQANEEVPGITAAPEPPRAGVRDQ